MKQSKSPLLISVPIAKKQFTNKEWIDYILSLPQNKCSIAYTQLSTALSYQLVAIEKISIGKGSLFNNYVFKQIIQYVSQLIIKHVYSPIKKYKIVSPTNIVAFSQITKFLYYNDKLKMPMDIKKKIRSHYVQVLYTKTHFSVFQQIQQQKNSSQILQKFVSQTKILIGKRIKMFQQIFKVEIYQYAEKLMLIFWNNSDECQTIHDLCIDNILLCVIYLVFIYHKKEVIFGKICDIYQQKSGKDPERKNVLSLYNDYLLQLHERQVALVHVLDEIKIKQPVLEAIISIRMEEDETILDMY